MVSEAGKHNDVFNENRIVKSHRKLYLSAFGVLIVAVFIIVLSLKWSGKQVIQSIEISGNRIIPSEEIQRQVGDSLLKTPNEKIKLEAIQKKLLNHPFIQETFVTHKSTNEIRIEIRERQPVAALVNSSGALTFIDEKGYTMPYRLFEKFADLPLVRNIYNGELINKSALQACMNILRELRKEENKFLYFFISEIIYEPEGNEFCFLTTDKQVKILFGKPYGFSDKISNLAEYWNNCIPVSDKSTVRYIDLRWDGSVVAGNF